MASIFVMLACAQGTTSAPTAISPDSATGTQTAEQSVRVTVQFRQPVQYNSASLLHSMEVRTRAQVRYIAPVSENTHIYSILPIAGTSKQEALQRLRSMPQIAWAEMDSKAQTH
jgi:hypothetical protein